MAAADDELEDLIRVRIEEPAAREIMELVRAGVIHDVDRELFSVSAKKYKEAIFAGYDSYEPVVRHELLKSLLQDYKHAIDELLAAIRGRAASSEIRTLRESRPRADSPVGQDALGRLDASEHPPGSEEAATNRSDAGETDDAPTSQSWVLDKLRSLKGRSKST